MIWAWIETSSAETGSSAMISFGSQRERPRDPDPLALAARELVRVAVVVLGVEADPLEQLLHRAPGRSSPVTIPWSAHRVADDLADALARVERGVGVLEDHLHLAVAARASCAARRAR